MSDQNSVLISSPVYDEQGDWQSRIALVGLGHQVEFELVFQRITQATY